MKQLASVHHPLVKHWVKLHKNRDYRYEHQRVMIEGIKSISEISKSIPIKSLIVIHEDLLPKKKIKAEEIFVVTEAMMKKISTVENPEGIVAEVAMPPLVSLKNKRHVLVLDGINDPGNMGTLLRTALAFGWDGAYILENSCDPFNDKALRAAKGATFRLPLAMGHWDSLQEELDPREWQWLAADLEGISPSHVTTAVKRALILGNESHGISEHLLPLCTQVTIAMPGEMESLNVSVAGGILMYLLATKK